MSYSILKSWLPLALVITGCCALVYGTVQQNYRLGLNDPQIQMAEDASGELARGVLPQSVVPAKMIDISSSLAPYVIVYDENLKPIAYSGTLEGEAPVPPKGVFDSAKQNQENRLSWEPQPSVRSAIVIRHYSGEKSGFVLAGRGMREVEKREIKLEIMVGIAWPVLLVGTFVLIAFFNILERRN